MDGTPALRSSGTDSKPGGGGAAPPPPTPPTPGIPRRRPPKGGPPTRGGKKDVVPRELGGSLVVARRGVVVEAVLRARVDVHRVLDLVRLERRLVGRPAGVDALVVLGVVDEQRRLDLRHVLGGGGWPP